MDPLASTPTFSEFQQQMKIALEMYDRMSEDDKLKAVTVLETLASKTCSSDGYIHDSKTTQRLADNDPSNLAPNITKNELATKSYPEMRSAFGIEAEGRVRNDDGDGMAGKVLEDVINLESETQMTDVTVTDPSQSVVPERMPSKVSEPSQLLEVKIPPIVDEEERKCHQCPSCSLMFSTDEALLFHVHDTHSVKDRPIKCPLCPASFSRRGNLNVHLRSSSHNGEKPFECTKCSARFGTSSNLRRHSLSHQGLKPYRCSTCQSRFTEKRSLIIHSRKHTGERPYVCPHCSKTFTQKNVLQTHIRTHTNDKQHSCPLCSKSFIQKSHLKRHSQYVHNTGVKTKSCQKCHLNFVTQADLDRHLKSITHAGDQPFLCAECGKRFMRQATLTEHINLSHSK